MLQGSEEPIGSHQARVEALVGGLLEAIQLRSGVRRTRRETLQKAFVEPPWKPSTSF